MRDAHIIPLIEEKPLGDLSAADLAHVRAHAADCDECRRSFEAAQVTARLLRGRAAVTAEPPPFFQTRVMAAIRERAGERRAPELSSFWKMWQSARALVASMALVVMLLTGLSLSTNLTQRQTTGYDPRELTSISDDDAAVSAIYTDDNPGNDDMTDGQVFTNLYAPEMGGTDGKQQ